MPFLLSYPRSGNHLVRFFIELISETPTHGVIGNRANDIHIYQNDFAEPIPFNIGSSGDYDFNTLYVKCHSPPVSINGPLIFIVRNPKEVLLRYNDNRISYEKYNQYFDLIDYYKMFSGRKLCLFYEDIVTDRIKFVNDLYEFLDIKMEHKKKYAIENIDRLFNLSATGTKRLWDGVKSDSVDFYYKNIPFDIKESFDSFIKNKINTCAYELIRSKYNL